MEVLTTPDERFEKLADFPFEPHYVEVPAPRGGTLRMHYLDEGPRDAPAIWLMHGLPSWSFLFRKLIPPLVDAGFRVVAPDLIGHGRSDKPTYRPDYTLETHIVWLREWLLQLDLSEISLLAHDWGGPTGFGVMAREEARFARVLAINTMLQGPTPEVVGRLGAGYSNDVLSENEAKMGIPLLDWIYYSQSTPSIVESMMTYYPWLARDPEVRAGYEAPFPDYRYEAGARHLPLLNPFTPNHPSYAINQNTWAFLSGFHRPFVTAYSQDPPTDGWDGLFHERVPGARGQAHVTFEVGVGHFVIEERPAEVLELVLGFIRQGA